MKKKVVQDMRGNSFGKLLTITSFGESHGEALGVVIDGLPPSLPYSLEKLDNWLKRRAPGQQGTTGRVEQDTPIILSGVLEGVTLGTPLCVIVQNKNQRSEDYDALKSEYRIGHADETTLKKFGIRDHRGGGRASGRETIARVIGGYFASLVLPDLKVVSKVVTVSGKKFENKEELLGHLLSLKRDGNSAPSSVELTITNPPLALGEPVFDKLKADLGKAMLSIGGCIGFSYGDESLGLMDGVTATQKRENFGGIEGGISNGDPILLNLTFKAPSTVGAKARVGRHDPCLVPRVLPVIESMAYLVIADHYLRQRAYENIRTSKDVS